MKTVITIGFAFALTGMIAGCGGTVQKLKDDVVNEVDNAGDTVSNVGEDVGDEVEGIVGDDEPEPEPAEPTE